MKRWAWSIPGFFLVLGLAFLGYAFISAKELDRSTFMVVGGCFVGTALFVMTIYALMDRRVRAARRLLRTGKRATATVLEVEDTGVTVNDNPRVRLKLRVQSDDAPEFELETKKVVSRVAIPQAGMVAPIRYDPDDPKDFVWDDGSSAAGRVVPVPADMEQTIRQALAMKGVTGPLADRAVEEAMAQLTAGHHTVDLRKYTQRGGAAQPEAPDSDDPLDRLKKLGELRDAGVLTDSEFQAQKARILAGL